MSDLPQGWAPARLGDFAAPARIGVDPASVPNLQYVGLEHIEAATTKILGTVPPSDVRSTSYHFASGSTLYSRLRPYLNKVCVVDFEGIGSGEFIIFPPSSHLARGFLKYLLNQPAFVQFTSLLDAGDRPRVNWDGIKNFACGLPPLAEQERIVAAVEEQFSRLDAGVVALERVRHNLKRMRDVVRFTATEGRLVPQDPNDEPAANLIARVKPTGRFRGSKSLPTDLGPLPHGWSWALMGALAQRVTVGHVGPMKDEYVTRGLPFLRSQNVREDRFDPRGLRFISPSFHERLSKSRLVPRDLVIVRSGNVGTACVVPDSLGEANCADLVIVQRPEAIDAHYAALYMNSLARARVRAGHVGVALTHFNTQSVAELPVPVPPMEEQKRIVAEAQRLMSVVDSLEADLFASFRKASALRSSVLASAFSGQLNTQDPTDEPASTLLEGIAEQRASANGAGSKQTRRRRMPREKAAI